MLKEDIKMITQIYSIEKWHAPGSPQGERWEKVTRVANRREAERLVTFLQNRDSTAYYSFFPDGEEIYNSADEYLMLLNEERKAS